MAHYSSVFSRVPIDLPNRSGFDLSHENLGTLTCGTLTPVLCSEVLPNDTISLGAAFQVQLPPMATDFYGKVDFVLEAFFVPSRLLWGGWQSFMTHPTANPQYPVNTPVQGKSKYMPKLNLKKAHRGVASLADYLGYKAPVEDGVTSEIDGTVNMLPFLAYHRIYDDWYRDSRIQAPLFYRPDSTVSATAMQKSVIYKPFVSGGVDAPDYTDSNSSYSVFTDGVRITDLRQRNWAKDYFTSASPLPQAGNASVVEFDVDPSSFKGQFSIATLRAANSLQKWLERNNIMGYRYSDQIYGQYGIYPSDAIMDKVIYLGRHTQNVYTRSVFQNAPSRDSSSSNPFKGVGTKFGSSQSIGEGSLVDSIRVTEHGFIMVLASIVPKANYSTGVRKYLNRSVVGDIAFPLLAGVGDQKICKYELAAEMFAVDREAEFGYTDRYAEYKYHDDEVHGLLRDGQSLEHFALQRSFVGDVDLGSAFLQIPKNYLDQVFNATVEISGLSAWYDIYFPFKKVSTLPEYSIPTLADLKHSHSAYVSRGGKRL